MRMDEHFRSSTLTLLLAIMTVLMIMSISAAVSAPRNAGILEHLAPFGTLAKMILGAG